MNPVAQLTEKEIHTAILLRSGGYPWVRVAAQIGTTEHRLRVGLRDEDYIARLEESRRRQRSRPNR